MQRSTFKLSVLASSILAVTTLGGCSFFDSDSKAKTEYKEAPLDEIVFDETLLKVNGSIEDAADPTKAMSILASNVTFKGDDAESIDQDSVEIINGNAITFTANKKDFAVNVLISDVEGYVDTGIQVSSEGQGAATFTIKMVSKANPPAGTKVEEKEFTDAVEGGVAQQEIKVTASVDNSDGASGETSEVRIPAETVMKDANGDVVDGSVTVTVAHHSATEEESTQAFPGGFAVAADTQLLDGSADGEGQGEESQEVAMVTAGFVSVKIEDENGNEVREFDTPIDITMQVAVGTEHASGPKQGDKIALNDTIPVWSYEEDKGTWTYEGEGDVVSQTADGKFWNVTYPVTHLSYWNLDWYNRGSGLCNETTVEVISDSSRYTAGPVTLEISNGTTSRSRTITDGIIDPLRRLQNDTNIDIKAYIDGNLVGSVDGKAINAENCGENIEVEITPPPQIEVSVSAKSVCDTDGSIINDSLNIATWNYSTSWSQGVTPYTIGLSEGSSLTTYLSKQGLPSTVTNVSGTQYSSSWNTETISSVSSTANSIEFTITQKCETVEVTGATGGSSGDQ